MTDCGAGMAEKQIVSLEEALDRHPCKECGGHYNNHWNLSKAEIQDARDQGCVVDICKSGQRWTFEEDGWEEEGVFFCLVLTPVEDPCDSAFMEEISS